jgi:hypothetical protein
LKKIPCIWHVSDQEARRTSEGLLLTPKRGQRLGDLLAEAFDRLPVDDDRSFVRSDQGEFERSSDLFGTDSDTPR